MPLHPKVKKKAVDVVERLFESFLDSLLEQGEEVIDEAKERVRRTRSKIRRPLPPRH